MLRLYFGFDRWHSESPISVRKYRLDIAKIANAINPQTVVDVGCGLGFALSLIIAPAKFGYDIDLSVINAARMLNGKNIKFKVGSFSEIDEPHIDLLIAVNWIHEISPDDLNARLENILKRTRYLLVDSIDLDNPLDYKYKHDFNFLISKASLVNSVRPEQEGRKLLLFKILL